MTLIYSLQQFDNFLHQKYDIWIYKHGHFCLQYAVYFKDDTSFYQLLRYAHLLQVMYTLRYC